MTRAPAAGGPGTGPPAAPAAADARDPERGQGLDPADAAALLRADGPNQLPAARPDTLLRQVGRQLRDVVILVLVVAAAITAAVGDLTDMSVIVAVIVVNTALGVAQERRSSGALAALSDLTAPRATVRRGGTDLDLDARDVVRGDLVVVTAGDIVPADGTLVTARALQVDEAAMTGESLPVDRAVGTALLAGTVVTRGRGLVTVTATGARTRLAGVARGVADIAPRTPLQVQLDRLGRALAVAVTLAAVVVVVLGVLAGRSWTASLVIGLSLAVAAIPESLPAVVSVALAMGARRMAAVGVLTRRLPAVEALGSVTVLATDKTGTLTTGTMALADVWTPPGADPDVLLESVVLCNDAGTGERDDPTETALLAGAQAAGLDVDRVRATWPRTAEVPFDATTARMTTTHAGPDGSSVEVTKGSPEAVLHLLAPSPAVSAARDQADARSRAGGRVLAVARRAPGAPWQLLGLAVLADPVRPEAGSFVAAFRAAGVRTVMITGDHPATAAAVAAAVGIDGEGPDRPRAVHARVRPEDKAGVVAALQDAGEVVAMTGDGVNDAPALRRADVGVAMGRRGSEVAKQAADLVLTGDDLGGLRAAIGEGRRVFDNLRRFLQFALSGGLAEVAIMLLGPAIGFAVPLTAGQILWVNLLTHGLPGVAMGNEPAESDVLTRPPRPPRQPVLDRATALRVAVTGTVITLGSLATALLVRHWDGSWRSALFATLGLSQLAVALGLRPWSAGWRANPMLPAAVVLNIALLVAALYWRPLQELLHTRSLHPAHLVVCAAVALLVGGIGSVVARVGSPRALGVDEPVSGPVR